MNWEWFHRLSSPKWFYHKTSVWLPWLWAITLPLMLFGVWQGLYNSPADYQQGNSVRIMYLHVPAAMASMALYVAMAIAAAVGYVWRIKLAHIVAVSIAPVGAAMTFIALFTGSFWGRPAWGTWWVWDARITSELILLFLYLGFISLHKAFEDREVADRAAGIIAMVGVINVPIIHYSVQWWNTLHQGATISKFSKPTIESSMLVALLVMIVAVLLFSTILIIMRIRAEILDREYRKNWVNVLLEQPGLEESKP